MRAASFVLKGIEMTHSMICTLAFTAAVAMASPALAKDARKDPEQIDNRNVGKGLNFYSLEDEIALGRQLASQVERQAKIVDDPGLELRCSPGPQTLRRCRT